MPAPSARRLVVPLHGERTWSRPGVSLIDVVTEEGFLLRAFDPWGANPCAIPPLACYNPAKHAFEEGGCPMDLIGLISDSALAGVVGFVAGTLAARRVHRSLYLDVNDALERVAYLYDRIRKRAKIDGSPADHPAETELRTSREGIMALAAQRGLLASQRR